MARFGGPTLDIILKNRPIPVVFQGWRSTTADLGRNGWEIGVISDPCTFSYRFLFGNKLLKLGAMVLDDYRVKDIVAWQDPRSSVEPAPIIINQLVSLEHFTLQVLGDNPLTSYREVDTQPVLQDFDIENLHIFNFRKEPEDSLFYDKADMSVVDHLEAILESQKDKQKELREKARKAGNSKDFSEKVKKTLVGIDI